LDDALQLLRTRLEEVLLESPLTLLHLNRLVLRVQEVEYAEPAILGLC
jgi:hypothetical protein